MEEARIRTLTAPKPLNQFGYRFRHITAPTQGVCAKFGLNRFSRYGDAHARKKRFSLSIFVSISINPAIYPVFHRYYRSQFSADANA